ncbi:hypothetical protein ACJX0J_038903, partial [Zea mays]
MGFEVKPKICAFDCMGAAVRLYVEDYLLVVDDLNIKPLPNRFWTFGTQNKSFDQTDILSLMFQTTINVEPLTVTMITIQLRDDIPLNEAGLYGAVVLVVGVNATQKCGRVHATIDQ